MTDGNAYILLLQSSNPGDGHGGELWSRRVLGFLKTIGEVRNIVPEKYPKTVSTLCRSLLYGGWLVVRSIRNYRRVGGLRWAIKRGLRDGLLHKTTKGIVAEMGRPSLVAIEDIRMFPEVAFLAEDSCPIVALPHNIEPFTYNPNAPLEDICRMLQHELRLYRKCQLVLTISEEDAWLLRNFGIRAFYLPYIPSREKIDWAKAVASERRANSQDVQKHILILGTVSNTPTLDGTRRLLDCLKEKGLSLEVPVCIVGSGTNEAFDEYSSESIRVCGRVSDSELMELLCSARALLVTQAWGAGVLTRVFDWLPAGIPIVCTEHAGRSIPRGGDVHICQDVEDAYAKACSVEPCEAPFSPILKRLVATEEEALRKVARLIQRPDEATMRS